MRKLIILLLLPFCVHAQSVPVSLISLSTVADLRLQSPQSNQMITILGLSSINDTNGGTYYWNAASTVADDGFITIQVTGISTGRWIRLGNGNTIKGNITISGLAVTTSYTVSYSSGTLPFVPITVILIPRSLAAAGLSWVSSITNSGFTVNFVLAPTIGTSNILMDYIVSKQ